MKIAFEDLFKLSCAAKRTGLHFDPVLEPEPDLGPYQALARGTRRTRSPVEHRSFTGGARAYDMHQTTAATVYIVSQGLVDLFSDHAFTGWGTFPVKTFGKDDKLVSGLHGLVVSGRCGPYLWEKAQIFLEEPLRPGGYRMPALRRLTFDLATWDGSDIFTPEDSWTILVRREVRDAIKKAKLANIRMTPATELTAAAVGRALERAIQGARERGEEVPEEQAAAYQPEPSD